MRERAGLAAQSLQVDIDDGRTERARHWSADDVAAKNQRGRIVNVGPAHDRKRCGVMQFPYLRRGGRRKTDQLAGFEARSDRELVRRPRELENLQVEIFAQGRRLWKLALEFASGKILGTRCDQEFRVCEWTPERDEIRDQPTRIGSALRVLRRSGG